METHGGWRGAGRRRRRIAGHLPVWWFVLNRTKRGQCNSPDLNLQTLSNPRIIRKNIRTIVVYALAFLGSCMALSRSYGLITDSSSTFYTRGVRSFEAFAGITGILRLRFLSRQE